MYHTGRLLELRGGPGRRRRGAAPRGPGVGAVSQRRRALHRAGIPRELFAGARGPREQRIDARERGKRLPDRAAGLRRRRAPVREPGPPRWPDAAYHGLSVRDQGHGRGRDLRVSPDAHGVRRGGRQGSRGERGETVIGARAAEAEGARRSGVRHGCYVGHGCAQN